MKWLGLVLLVPLVSCLQHKTNIKKLTLIKAYEIETLNHIEPSGLTLWDGVFYTVSDKDNFIYRLSFKEDHIDLIPVIEIDNDKDFALDFEGITHDDSFFYLVSEAHFSIVKVAKDGSQQTWLPADDALKKAGKDQGLFQVKNAYFEGICSLGDGQFLLTAERQPRGFMHVNLNNNEVLAYVKDAPVFQYRDNRSPDFTGLSCNTNGLYVLDRNAYAIAELEKNQGQYQEGQGYSYSHVINQSHYQYQDMQYGQAEGLVVEGDSLYILLDNNRNFHSQQTDNNNSLFFEFKK